MGVLLNMARRVDCREPGRWKRSGVLLAAAVLGEPVPLYPVARGPVASQRVCQLPAGYSGATVPVCGKEAFSVVSWA